MKKCIIITSHIEGKIKDIVHISPGDCVVCADGGYDLALAESIFPHVVIGDLDSSKTASIVKGRSSSPRPGPEFISAPRKKNQTDTALCLEYAVKEKYPHALIIGGIGGRLDHTLANIQNLFAYTLRGLSVMMADEQNIVMPLINSHTVLPHRPGWKLSLFSHSNRCQGVTVTGVQYPLSGHTLTSHFPLGISNEFVGEDVSIQVEEGQLLIVLSRD